MDTSESTTTALVQGNIATLCALKYCNSNEGYSFDSVWYLPHKTSVCFPGMTSLFFVIFLNTQMDLFILKTDGEKFTPTNKKKTLHLIFNVFYVAEYQNLCMT